MADAGPAVGDAAGKAPAKPRVASGTAGTFAGRHPPNNPNKRAEFSKLKLHYLESRLDAVGATEYVPSKRLNTMTNPRTFNFLDLGKYSTQSVFLKRSNSPLFCSGLAGGSEGQSPCPQSHTWQSIKCQTIEKLNKICSKEDC